MLSLISKLAIVWSGLYDWTGGEKETVLINRTAPVNRPEAKMLIKGLLREGSTEWY